jgi:hypothetical protein
VALVRRLSEKLVTIFANRGCRVVSTTDLLGRTLDFYTEAASFSIKQLFNCTYEADWTPF